MKNPVSQYLYSVFRQAAGEFRQFAQKLMQGLSGTPFPRILVALIAAFLLITLVPLLLSLFIALILIRLLLAILPFNKKPGKPEAAKRSLRN